MKTIKQKIYGLILIILGIASIPVTNDCTIALIFIPIGLFAILTKENIII